MTRSIAQAAFGLAPSRPRGGFVGRLLAVMAVRRSQRRLEDLDAHLLRDVGLSRGEAAREARRPVWDAPDHWLR